MRERQWNAHLGVRARFVRGLGADPEDGATGVHEYFVERLIVACLHRDYDLQSRVGCRRVRV